jgi:hypothetical protein
MGYRGSNNRDRDNAAEERRLSLSERLRRIGWAMAALVALLAAAVVLPAIVAIRRWFS